MKTKFNLERDKLKSDYIQKNQDYKKVLDGFQKLKPPIWKNPWFYGPIGLASFAAILMLTFQKQVNAYGNNSIQLSKNQKLISLPSDSHCITKPISGIDIPMQIYPVYPEKGLKIELKSGTNITIPAHSLKSEKGSVVQIKVREFNDKTSAFVAGIPMDFGDDYAFESAGMLEIRAEKDGKSIFLNHNKPIEITMNLHQDPIGFQFWKLNEVNKTWVETDCIMHSPTFNPKESDLRIKENQINAKQQEIKNCEREIEVLLKNDKTTIENSNLLPSDKAKKLIIDFEKKDFPELLDYSDIEFEYVLPENRNEGSMKAYDKSIKYTQSQVWNDMDIVKQQNHYLATFRNDRENTSLLIRPVLKGKSLLEMQEKLLQASENKSKLIQKLKEEKIALQREESKLKAIQLKLETELRDQIQRKSAISMEQRAQEEREGVKKNRTIVQQGTANFKTTSFGVFNCDKPIEYPKGLPFLLSFETKEGLQVLPENTFVFDRKKNTRYSFGELYTHKLNQMGWFDNEGTLLIIAKNGDVYFRKDINEHSPKENKVIVQKLNSKDLSFEAIQKLICETTVFV